MFDFIKKLLRSAPWNRQQVQSSPQSLDEADHGVPKPEAFPQFPPAPPRVILQDPSQYWSQVTARQYDAPMGVFKDTSLFALYRLYELIVLDKVLSYRNALEAFWRTRNWPIQEIEDPKDDDPERYAVLAGCTYLLMRSFNQRVKLGLRRDMPSLITPEEAEMLRQIPDESRPYEAVPEWATQVAPLSETLAIPTEEGEILTSKDDDRADPDFLSKNILLSTPHISFT
ncbi:uncharacterized protein E0L32_005810 [Thyridium curvatum]|uniref:Uncharacterized protein n=1 Tax=Thyridium curvatum TaxID=1093900 RepID=A0A507B465_9PEZI|nr:uncharacterized protein E0L32_005810 [Thyridium curvatum]TPX13866.1 hypothetical protein E0L32_005810 [Thyridium curvatum]